MQQDESKFKGALVDAFCEITGGKRHPDSFYFYIIAGSMQKSGIPDLFFTALGGHAWVEAKVSPNQLSAIQMINMTRMRRGGSRTLILTVSHMDETKTNRTIAATLISPNGEMWSQTDYPWSAMTELAFWRFLLGVPHHV